MTDQTAEIARVFALQQAYQWDVKASTAAERKAKLARLKAAVEACKYYFRENEKFIQKDGRNYSAKLTDIRNETKIAKLYGYFYNGENSYITQIKTKFSYVSLNNEKIKKEYVIQVYAEPFSVNYFTLEMIDEVHGELEWEIESVYGLDFILHDKNGFGAIK